MGGTPPTHLQTGIRRRRPRGQGGFSIARQQSHSEEGQAIRDIGEEQPTSHPNRIDQAEGPSQQKTYFTHLNE